MTYRRQFPAQPSQSTLPPAMALVLQDWLAMTQDWPLAHSHPLPRLMAPQKSPPLEVLTALHRQPAARGHQRGVQQRMPQAARASMMPCTRAPKARQSVLRRSLPAGLGHPSMRPFVSTQQKTPSAPALPWVIAAHGA